MGGGCNSKHYWLMELLLDLGHGLMLLWFADLMNVTEEVTIYRPNFSTLLSNAFIRGNLNDIYIYIYIYIYTYMYVCMYDIFPSV